MSDASYAIEVAAAMPGGEKTVSELQAMTKALLGAGVNADALHDAVALAANSLSAASAASATANANFARGTSELKSLEKAALAAAKAEQEAAKLGVVPPNVAASVVAATQAIADHKVKLDALKATAATAGATEKELARQLDNVKQAAAAGGVALASKGKHAAALNDKLGKLEATFVAIGGPLGALGDTVVGPLRAFGALSDKAGAFRAAMVFATVGAVAL